MDKEFKTINQLVSILEERGLTIDNKPKLIKYLREYGYFTVINGYNDLFCHNEDRKSNAYKKEATSSSILELFELDQKISSIYLNYIFNIEKKINNSISYFICLKNKESMKYGQLLKLSRDLLKNIFDFSNLNIKNLSIFLYKELKKVNGKTKLVDYKSIDRIVNDRFFVDKLFGSYEKCDNKINICKFLQGCNNLILESDLAKLNIDDIELLLWNKCLDILIYDFTKYIKNKKWKDKKYLSIYENLNEIPIWKMTFTWTFGTLVSTIKSMSNKNIKGFIKQFKTTEKIAHKDFIGCLVMINSIRNILCHNQVFYNTDYRMTKKQINNILGKKINSKIRLFEIGKIIDLLNCKNDSILNKVKNILLDFYNDESSFISENIKKLIIENMGFSSILEN